MNKFYLVFISIAMLGLSSCSKDFLKSYDRRIIGNWTITDVDRNGFGGNTSDLPFREGSFSFASDGSLTYTDAAGIDYSGTWNIEKKNYNDQLYQSLEIQVVDFNTQRMRAEYYDDIDFTSTGHFKARINQGLHSYVTHYRKR